MIRKLALIGVPVFFDAGSFNQLACKCLTLTLTLTLTLALAFT